MLPLKKRPAYRDDANSPPATATAEAGVKMRTKIMRVGAKVATDTLSHAMTTRAKEARRAQLRRPRASPPAHTRARAHAHAPVQVTAKIATARSLAELARAVAMHAASADAVALAGADAATAREEARLALVEYTHNALKWATAATPSMRDAIADVAVGEAAFIEMDGARDKLAHLHALLADANVVADNMYMYVYRYHPTAKNGKRCDVRARFELYWDGELLAKVGSCGRRKLTEARLTADRCADFPQARAVRGAVGLVFGPVDRNGAVRKSPVANGGRKSRPAK